MDGTIEIAHQEVRKAVRKQQDKNAYCSVGIINSSSVEWMLQVFTAKALMATRK